MSQQDLSILSSELKELKNTLALARQRAERYKRARDTAEQLLEQKASELFETNRALHASRDNLKADIDQATYELQASNTRLQKALEEKSTFIGALSHEIRTPLNAVIGLSELLLDMQMPALQRGYLETIFSSANSLTKLINGVLDISKIEAGKVNLSPSVSEPRVVVENLFKMFWHEANSKNVQLIQHVSTSVPDHLLMDESRYAQIITNLISNALKNTESGNITLSLHYQDPMLITSVKDTGCGIEPEQISKIFKAYEQFGNLNQGVGLGLAICKQLCNAMQGNIRCISEVNQGSEFVVELPLEIAKQTPQEKRQENHDLSGLRILIAEDNPVNQNVLEAQFSQFGIHPVIVDNGQIAFDMLKQSDDFHAVFLDIQMPILDGEQTLLAIRQSANIRHDLYCIALTATSYFEKREELLKLGFNEFLSKPLLLDGLKKVLSTLKLEDTAIELAATTSGQSDKDSLAFFESQFGDAAYRIFKQMAPVFIEHSLKDFKALEQAASKKQTHHVKKISHSLKGACASMGLKNLTSQFSELEQFPDTAREALPNLSESFQTVKRQFDALLKEQD